jgi:hypothetical protein
MNLSLLRRFSPEILAGAQRGRNSSALGRLLSVSDEQLADMKAGLKPLSTARARLLEEHTGRTIGELALLGIVKNASPKQRAANAKLIRDTMRLNQIFDSSLNGSPAVSTHRGQRRAIA